MSKRNAEIGFTAKTNKGRVRKHNEDAIFGELDAGLWVVADGMGGYACGEVASAISIDTIVEAVKRGVSVSKAIEQAHDAVTERTEADVSTKGMASTVVVLTVINNHYEVFWVGDSRAYCLRNNNLVQLSRDHSYLEWLIDKGLSREQAANDPKQARLTQGVGLRKPNVDTASGKVKLGDRFLLCSDGVYGELKKDVIESLLRSKGDSESVTQAIIDAALANGGKDNISAIVVDIEPSKRKQLYIWLNTKVKLKKIGAAWRLWAPAVAGISLAALSFLIFLMLRS